MLVPLGLAADSRSLHWTQAQVGRHFTAGALSVHFVPFVRREHYDELLWACDLNFVRGEDSFVRAHWASRPLVWQIYPQADDAHRAKLDAYLELAGRHADPAASAVQTAFWHARNGFGGEVDWPAGRPPAGLQAAAGNWQRRLRHLGDGRQSGGFCENQVE